MSLLSGLEALGLGNLESAKLYEEEKDEAALKKEVVVEEEPEKSETEKEAEFLFGKTYTCPICDSTFKTKTVRAGKAKMLGSDPDLRPRYEGIDVLKYDTVVCPGCGYSALSRYYKFMTSVQARFIKEGICMNYRPHSYDGDIYTYDEALERYKLVLANAVVKRAKPSEKAYICLKTGWLLRGMLENLEMDRSYVKKKLTYTREEEEFLRSAYDGFLTARSTEPFPMCGMDEATIDYLLAALAIRFNDYEVAGRLISELISSKTVNSRTKEKTRLLKEELEKEMKQSKKQNQ